MGDKFSIADIAMTPYVDRLGMMGMEGMWENDRLPKVECCFKRIKASSNFQKGLID